MHNNKNTVQLCRILARRKTKSSIFFHTWLHLHTLNATASSLGILLLNTMHSVCVCGMILYKQCLSVFIRQCLHNRHNKNKERKIYISSFYLMQITKLQIIQR